MADSVDWSQYKPAAAPPSSGATPPVDWSQYKPAAAPTSSADAAGTTSAPPYIYDGMGPHAAQVLPDGSTDAPAPIWNPTPADLRAAGAAPSAQAQATDLTRQRLAALGNNAPVSEPFLIAQQAVAEANNPGAVHYDPIATAYEAGLMDAQRRDPLNQLGDSIAQAQFESGDSGQYPSLVQPATNPNAATVGGTLASLQLPEQPAWQNNPFDQAALAYMQGFAQATPVGAALRFIPQSNTPQTPAEQSVIASEQAHPGFAGLGGLVGNLATYGLTPELRAPGVLGGLSDVAAQGGLVGRGASFAGHVIAHAPQAFVAGGLPTAGEFAAASRAHGGSALDQAGAGLMGALAGTTEFSVPVGVGTGRVVRAATGAGTFGAINTLNNAATGQPLTQGLVTSLATGAVFGGIAGKPLPYGFEPDTGATVRDANGRVIARGVGSVPRNESGMAIWSPNQLAARVNLFQGSVAKQDLNERLAAVSAHLGGPVPDAYVQQLAGQVAAEHGVSIGDVVQAPAGPLAGGAAAADAALNEARQTTAAATPDISLNPVQAGSQEARDLGLEPAAAAPTQPAEAVPQPLSTSDLAPRVTALPEAPQGVSRDDLVQQWHAARTDNERSAAAANIAAFDQQAQQAAPEVPASAPVIPDFPNLSPRQREVETRARDQVLADPGAAVRAYQELPGTDGGRIISTDEAREIFPDYNSGPEARSANAVAVHEPASFVAKAAWKQALANPRTGEQAFVLFTGGGTGAGKTTGMSRVPTLKNDRREADIVYDGNLQSAPSAIKKINEALKSKRKVRVVYTFRDPVQSFVHGTLPRAEWTNYGRTVPIPEHVSTHTGAAETYLSLKQHYADNPNVTVEAIYNNHDPRQGVSEVGHADDAIAMNLAARNRDTLATEVRNDFEQERQAGRVSDRVYYGTLGIEAPHDSSQPQGGVGSARPLDGQPEAPGAAEAGTGPVRPQPLAVDGIGEQSNPVSGAAAGSLGQGLEHNLDAGDAGSGLRSGNESATESSVTQTPPGGVSGSGTAHATAEPPASMADTAVAHGPPTDEVPVDDIGLTELPQFKEGADENGVVEKLGGKFDRRGVAPVQLWQSLDGKLHMASGRHRLDLAKRSGEKTIPAQIYREADGYTREQMAALDAELNIRDGQGKVADYVQYFQTPAFDGPEGRQTAESRGLLARATGRRAYTIANAGDAELIAAHRAGQLSDEAALQIAQAAPGDGRLQALGMKLIQQGRSITQAVNTVHAVRSLGGDRVATGDMFGFDDSAIRDAEAMAKVAAAHQRDSTQRLAAITGAAKRPELARQEGIDIHDPAAVTQRIGQLRADRDAWEHWATDPDRVAQVRQEAGLSERAPPEPEAPDETTPVDDRTASMFSRDAKDTATHDLLGAPTARENTRAAQEAKDAERNGKTGGRADTGDGGLFDGPQPKQDDFVGGHKFSRTAPSSIDRPLRGKNDLLAVWTALARHDEASQHPISDADTLPQVFRDVLPDSTVAQSSDEADRNMERPDVAWTVRLADGASAHVYQKGKQVWLDVSGLTQNKHAGSRIYNAVANYAHNTGRVFIGDPSGLSDVAMKRRLDNMLSSALKFGTTRHLAPHERQTEGTREVPGLDWRHGDDDHNIEAMLRLSSENTLKEFPELRNLTFNAKTGKFESPDGSEFTDAKFRALAEQKRLDAYNGIRRAHGRSPVQSLRHSDTANLAPGDRAAFRRAYTAGRASLKRAVLTNSLVRGAGAEIRRRLLGATSDGVLVHAGDRPLDPSLHNILYSRDEAPADAGMSGGTSTGEPEFIRALKPTELRKRALDRAWDAIPRREGYDVVFMPYGAEGKGFYYRPKPARLSRGTEAAQGIYTTDQVRDAAVQGWGSRFIKKLERAGRLEFLTSDELLGRRDSKGKPIVTRGDLDRTKGVYHAEDGKAYIITDQIRDLKQVAGTVLHEAGLHYGYDRLTTPEQRLQLRRRVSRAIASGDPEMIEAWKHAEAVGTPAQNLHEEAMAYLVENRPGHGIAQRVVDAFKRGLNRLGVPMDLLQSDSDAIRMMARDSLRRAAKGEQLGTVHVDEDGASASERATTSDVAEASRWLSRSGLQLPGLLNPPKGMFGRVLTEADLIKYRAARGDIRYSKDLLGDDDTELGRARRAAAATRGKALSQLAAEGYPQGALGWTGDPNAYEGARGAVQNITKNFVDRYDPIKRIQAAIMGGDANLVDDSANVYRLENLMHGKVGAQLDTLDHAEVRPLIKSMRQLHVSSDLLNDYLLARHAPERNARIAEINKAMPDGGSGVSTQAAKDFMDGKTEGWYSGQKLTPDLRDKLALLAQRVDRIRDNTLNTLEASGQLPKPLVAQLRRRWKYYVPLRGKGAEGPGAGEAYGGGFGGGLNIKGKPIKRALGRGEGNLPAPHILGEVIGDAQRAIIQGEKANVGRALLKLALAHPNPGVWQVEPVDLEWKFSEATGEAYLGTKRPSNDQDVLTVVHNGTPYLVRLVDPRLQEAILNLDARKAEWVVSWIGRMNRWLSATFTRYNPAFVPINMMRDLLLGTVSMTAEHGIGQSATALKYYFPALRAAWRDFGAEHPGDASVPDAQKTMDDWAREYSEHGGRTGIGISEDPTKLAKHLADSVKTGLQILGETTLHPMTWGKPIQATGRALSYLKPVIDVVERTNDATENAMRLAAYVARRKGGASADAAADYAKNITVNFNRKGKWGSVLNSVFLFYNASLQGTRRIVTLMREHPKGMAAFLGSLAALQAQQAAVLMSRKDQDGISDWDAIPAYKKSTALIIALPGKGHYYALPMPYEFGFIAYTGGRLMQQFMEHDPSQKNDNLLGDLGTAFLHSFSPVPLEQGLTGLIPAPIQAFTDVEANKDDMGRTITFGEDDNGYAKPQSALGRPGVPEPYVWLSRALNKIGGGDPDWRPPTLASSVTDVSPESLQFLGNFFLGGMGSFVSGSWRSAQSMLAGVYTDKQNGETSVDWGKLTSALPIVSRFGIQTNTNRARSDRFYDIRDELSRTKAMIQNALDQAPTVGTGQAIQNARQVAQHAGIFGDGFTIARNRNGAPSTKAATVNGLPAPSTRILTVGAVPGTLAGAYQEAEYGLTVNHHGRSIMVQPGVRDYNRMIQSDMGLPGTERDSAVNKLQNARSGLMGAFLRFYEQRQQQIAPNAKR